MYIIIYMLDIYKYSKFLKFWILEGITFILFILKSLFENTFIINIKNNNNY